MPYPRQSPVHAAIASLNPTWGQWRNMEVPKYFRTPREEAEAVGELALADLSVLPKFGLKGAAAPAWLSAAGLSLPGEVYGWHSLEAQSGRIIRTGLREFFLEDGFSTERVQHMVETFVPQPGVYPVIRQDAGFLLCGRNAATVLAQTCGVNFSEPVGKVVLSRVAGVSCILMTVQEEGQFSARIWCAAPYGIYLWTTLLEIVNDLGGMPVGLESIRGGENK